MMSRRESRSSCEKLVFCTHAVKKGVKRRWERAGKITLNNRTSVSNLTYFQSFSCSAKVTEIRPFSTHSDDNLMLADSHFARNATHLALIWSTFLRLESTNKMKYMTGTINRLINVGLFHNL